MLALATATAFLRTEVTSRRRGLACTPDDATSVPTPLALHCIVTRHCPRRTCELHLRQSNVSTAQSCMLPPHPWISTNHCLSAPEASCCCPARQGQLSTPLLCLLATIYPASNHSTSLSLVSFRSISRRILHGPHAVIAARRAALVYPYRTLATS